jgi:enterochelin esterase-like enzyme
MALLKDYHTHLISSATLNRVVRTDFYTSDIHQHSNQTDLLFINDGQDLLQMDLKNWLNEMNAPLMVVGIHAGIDRKQEYGVAGMPDFMNRGSRAEQYANFIMQELLPHVNNVLGDCTVRNKYVAGFSLGGLMAFDLAMEFPTDFNAAGVFSGSFWWRSKDLKDGYVEERDRIMHAKIRTKKHNAHQRFFLQTGALDEKADRNKNGIIDSIDDTLDIIKELESIGFDKESQIKYVELADGAHDLATWSRVMPGFLNWLSLK